MSTTVYTTSLCTVLICGQCCRQVSGVSYLYTKNTHLLLHPVIFLLVLVTVEGFIQEEINSPEINIDLSI